MTPPMIEKMDYVTIENAQKIADKVYNILPKEVSNILSKKVFNILML
jgi:hypothetical protein